MPRTLEYLRAVERALSFDDLAHYRRTVAALAETLRLMADVDAAVEEHGGWPLG